MEANVGFVPRLADLDLTALPVTAEALNQAMAVDLPAWRAELESHEDELFRLLGDAAPPALRRQREVLLSRLGQGVR